MEKATTRPQPLFVPGDLDGFFGLAVDNLIQFLLVMLLCGAVLGFPAELIASRVLPGAAMSLLAGNLFYAWQAQQLSARQGRTDVTALPYGINTVSLFAYVFLVMLPVKLAALDGGASPERAAEVAWQIGLAACLVSGIIESLGSLVAERIRRATPRAALLATLAGIAISFIAIDFAVRTFERPMLAILPLAVILATYFGKAKLPFRIPGGAWAVGLGATMAWILAGLGQPSPVSMAGLSEAAHAVSFHLPLPVIGDVFTGFLHPLFLRFFVPVMLPMGLFNVLGSLQNIESAEAAGDSYPTLPSLLVNGLGSILAATFGSCFPTTIYIGHPGWKALGARSGYSILNGLLFTVLALFGLTALISALVPIEAGMAIVLWVGVVITAQAFTATPARHAPAVAIGLFPAIAAWGVLILGQAVGAATHGDAAAASAVYADPGAFAMAGMHLPGLIALSQGFMLSGIVWSAASAELIDQRFGRAALWMIGGAALALFGFIHSGHLTAAGAVTDIGLFIGGKQALGYALASVFFALLFLGRRRAGAEPETAPATRAEE